MSLGSAPTRPARRSLLPQGHVGAMARDEWGHLALITALSVVDDTTLLRKAVVADLQVGRRAALLLLLLQAFLFCALLALSLLFSFVKGGWCACSRPPPPPPAAACMFFPGSSLKTVCRRAD